MRRLAAILVVSAPLACGRVEPSAQTENHSATDVEQFELGLDTAWNVKTHPPLDRLAATWASAWQPHVDRGEPDPAVLEAHAESLGFVGSGLTLQWVSSTDAARVMRPDGLTRPPLDHRVGLAGVRHESGWHVAAVVTAPHRFDAEPFERRLQRGETTEIRITLRPPYRHPRLTLGLPDGRFKDVVSERPDRLEHTVRCLEPGTRQVELLADGPHGPTVLFNVAVACGEPLPEPPSLKPRPVTAASSTHEVRMELLQQLNEARRARGRPALRLHASASQVATRHSRDMVRQAYFGHVGSDGATPERRLRRAGIRARVWAENVGFGRDAAHIHEALMRSPAHRRNIVNPDVTAVGIGVVAQRTSSHPVFWVTQDFID